MMMMTVLKSPIVLAALLALYIEPISGQYRSNGGRGSYDHYQQQQIQDENRQRNLGGLIDVDVHPTNYGGKHVGVHVPIFYRMDLDKEPHRTGLGISVLEGLIKVRVKKNPYKDHNNVLVALAGLPLYDNY